MSLAWDLYNKERDKLSSSPCADDDGIALARTYEIISNSNNDELKKSWEEDVWTLGKIDER